VKLVLDGSGPKAELSALSEKLGLKDKVVFTHAGCDQELAQLYAACDTFIFPSAITWGLAVVEAMASAKPVIVSKACGASEIIADNVNGMVVDHAQPAEMAKKAELLINDSQLRKKIGDNAKRYIIDNFSWEKFSQQVDSIFRRITGNYQ
jgi:glycosyltransferase involved in cell wall biosynthesis